MPYPRVIGYFGFSLQPIADFEGEAPVIARAVSIAVGIAARRLTPGSQCLPQALAAGKMLARRGVRATLYIGLLGQAHSLRPHAWLCIGRDGVIGLRGSRRARLVVCYR